MTKECPGCGRELDGDAFTRNNARRDGLSRVCRRCAKRKREGLPLVMGSVEVAPEPVGPWCERCKGPVPCDCWKLAMTPEERDAAQMVALTRHLVALDARARQREFLKHQQRRQQQESRGGRRGVLPPTMRSRVLHKVRFAGQR